MTDLWLKIFTICLGFISIDLTVANIVCRKCDQYLICGIKTPHMPDCFNGLPCTKTEYSFCAKIATSSLSRKCERPGLFMNFEFPSEFYSCEIKKKNLTFVKKKLTCPKNTTFDSITMRCLSEKQKTMLKIAEELTASREKKERKFYCKQIGTFSDPYDCKLYHVCNSKLESRDFYCPLGTYFNGKNCRETKTKKCMNQLIRQYINKIIQANAVYKYVKYLVKENSLANAKHHNSVIPIVPGVIKKIVYETNQTRYTYYGIKRSANHSKYNDSKILEFERFVETVIAESQKEKNQTIISSILEAASKTKKDVAVHTEELFTKPSGQILLGANEKTCKPMKRKFKVTKVTIIHLIQNTCKFEKNSDGNQTLCTTNTNNSRAETSTKKNMNHYFDNVTIPPLTNSTLITKKNTTNNITCSTTMSAIVTDSTTENFQSTTSVGKKKTIFSSHDHPTATPITEPIKITTTELDSTTEHFKSTTSVGKKKTTFSSHDHPTATPITEPITITTTELDSTTENIKFTTSGAKTKSPSHDHSTATPITEPITITTTELDSTTENIKFTTSGAKTKSPSHDHSTATPITEPITITTTELDSTTENIKFTTSGAKTKSPSHDHSTATPITEPITITTTEPKSTTENIKFTTSGAQTKSPSHDHSTATPITEPITITITELDSTTENIKFTTSGAKTKSPSHDHPTATPITEPITITTTELDSTTENIKFTTSGAQTKSPSHDHSTATPITEPITITTTELDSATEHFKSTISVGKKKTTFSSHDHPTATPITEPITITTTEPKSTTENFEISTFIASDVKKKTTSPNHDNPTTSVTVQETTTAIITDITTENNKSSAFISSDVKNKTTSPNCDGPTPSAKPESMAALITDITIENLKFTAFDAQAKTNSATHDNKATAVSGTDSIIAEVTVNFETNTSSTNGKNTKTTISKRDDSRDLIIKLDGIVLANSSSVAHYNGTFHLGMIITSIVKKTMQNSVINTSNAKPTPVAINSIQKLDPATYLHSKANIYLTQSVFTNMTSNAITHTENDTHNIQHILKIISINIKPPISLTNVTSHNNDFFSAITFPSDLRTSLKNENTNNSDRTITSHLGTTVFFPTSSSTEYSSSKIKNRALKLKNSLKQSYFSTNKYRTIKNGSDHQTNKKFFKPFFCKQVGLFRDPNECHNFYRCEMVEIIGRCLFCKPKRWKFKKTHHKCKGGKWFCNFFRTCIKFRPRDC